MSRELIQRIFDELEGLAVIDAHTHINPHSAASRTLADILGYHYYTELAHSAGLPRVQIEEPGLDPKTRVGRLVPKLGELRNTVQLSWLVEMCREFFDFDDQDITADNWESLYDRAAAKMATPNWEQHVLTRSGLEQVYLTNDFDDSLEGFDTGRYVPCLRTDDLVFHLAASETRSRLSRATGIEPTSADRLTQAIGRLFEHFTGRGARACAISLPPDFAPHEVDSRSADTVVQAMAGGRDLLPEDVQLLGSFVFWTIAGFCAEFRLPFDLMIGVNRRVYEKGVYQGQDLYDQRVSLIQYRKLFNTFPSVTFPVSVLAQTSGQELASYAWIFPNVVTNGHWWYSNIPACIELDTRMRLQSVPMTKQIGYYSDMYKLEFALPKFRMYRRILARVLARDFVLDRDWSETEAIELGRCVLRGNVERIFGS